MTQLIEIKKGFVNKTNPFFNMFCCNLRKLFHAVVFDFFHDFWIQ